MNIQVNKIITDKVDELKRLCNDYRVKSMHVFGSVCTDEFTDNSDIDILISFDNISIEQYTDNYFELHYELQNLFGRKIDLLTDKSLSNPYFINGIEQTKPNIWFMQLEIQKYLYDIQTSINSINEFFGR